MKNILYIFIPLLLLISCNNHNEKNIETTLGLEEKFVIKGFNIGVEIYLFPDFTFLNRFYSKACLGGFFIKDVTGTYKLDGQNVIFSPQTMIFQEDWESHEISNTTKIDTISYYISDSTKIQSEYKIVEISDVKFLVSESDINEHDDIFYKNSNFIALANLYNSYKHEEATRELLANKDTMIDFRNLNMMENIPTKWQDYFLQEPIRTEITSVRVVKNVIRYKGTEEDCGYTLIPTYKLNAGAQRGIKEGMILYSKKGGEIIGVTIIQVEENESIAEGEDIFYFDTKFKVGTILSTKAEYEQL